MKKIIICLSIALTIAVSIFCDVLFSQNGLAKVRVLEAETTRLEQEQQNLKRRIYLLEQQRNSLSQGGEERERVIHNELGMIHEDEVIVDLSTIWKNK